MKHKLISLLAFFYFTNAFTQIVNYYDNCDCNETIHYSEIDKKVKNGAYIFECKNSFKEIGNYKEGKKNDLWTVTNRNNIIVSNIHYTDGMLDGSYELFHFDGITKLKANFIKNTPTGEWIYYNEKGKVIKQGTYENGKPIGIWKVYNDKGNKIISEYDFDMNKPLIVSESRIENSCLPRDDESGEYIINSFLERKQIAINVPFEGNIISNREFIDLFHVPFVLMNTFTKYNFKINAKIVNGTLVINSIDNIEYFNYKPNALTYQFISQTNSPHKIKHILHTDFTKDKVKERIFETLMILGPWISNSDDDFEFQIPFVLNDFE